MPRDLRRYKALIDRFLKKFLYLKQKELTAVNQWGDDVMKRLQEFVVRGKTVRGSLVIYTYRLFKKDLPDFLIDVAGGVELFHSGFLIHDDIMDHDTLRRGKPTIHTQYQELARRKGGQDVKHFGVSEAINTADLCFFLGNELLARSSKSALHQKVGQELQKVVLAQMMDVAGGHLPQKFTKDEILALYRYKTARYTFSLPMAAGAMLADASPQKISQLEELGEHLGILYQLRDDELNQLGDVKQTGKSAGSDRLNRKQTLSSLVSKETLKTLRHDLIVKSNHLIDSLAIASRRQKELKDLLHFCTTREQ